MDKKLLKLSKTLSLTEARFAAAAGFEFIGFCFDKEDKNYISPTQAKAIIDWLSGPQMVAEFTGNHTVEEIEQVISLLGFEYIETGDPEIIKAFRNSDTHILSRVYGTDDEAVSWYIFPQEEVPVAVKHKTLAEIPRENASQLPALLSEGIAGFSFTGVPEHMPGMGDVSDLSEVLDYLEN